MRCECTRVSSILIKYFMAFIANAYNDVEGLEERRMSWIRYVMYGLLQQATSQRN